MNKVIVIAGPTASGKTGLGIEVAGAIGGEIISADSMQVYKNMPIATAAPTDDEKSQAPHHLVEFLDNDKKFSVARWCALAKEKIDDIISRGKVPIVVGGTGLFIDSLVDNISFEDVEVDEDLRQSLMKRDVDSLYDELLRVDKKAAENIHKNNKKRVVRALELHYLGSSKTEQNENSQKEKSPYDFLYFVLQYENRQTLYDRINLRVDKMLENGLLDEARAMQGKCQKTCAQAIGHKELARYLNGEASLEECAQKLKQESRRYAKRQITWFKRRQGAVFISMDKLKGSAVKTVIDKSEDFLNG